MTIGEIVARRRKDALMTRTEMLAAARRRFLLESYENVGLRDIARDVGVDVALVSRYFGSKEELFKEVLRGDDEDKFRIEVGADGLAGYLTAMFEEKGGENDREHVERLVIILRSASSPQASAIVREAIHEDVLHPIADLLGGTDAEIRASMALTVLLGGTVLRSIMSVDTYCDERTAPAWRERMHALLQTALAQTAPAVTERASDTVA